MNTLRRNLRRMLSFVLAVALVFPWMQGSAHAAARTDVYVRVDDEPLMADIDAYAENGRTMVPFRALFEALHAKVKWDPATQTVTGETADRTVTLKVNATTATVNGKSVILDAPARMEKGRVMVPLRFVSESLGYPVLFNINEFGLQIVRIYTHPAVTVQYTDAIDGPEGNDYSYIYHLIPAERYIFESGGQTHILHAKSDKVTISHFDRNLKLVGKTEVKAELPYFGGFHQADDGYYYIIYGDINLEDDDNKVVYRIVKYDQTWKIAGQADIRGAHVGEAFVASNVTMDSRGDLLVIHSARERYLDHEGVRHQSNITFKIRMSDMAVIEKGGEWPINHVSHSFATYVRFDGDRIVYADHGDAFPRSFLIQREENGEITGAANVIPFPGIPGDNYTGGCLGGLAVTDSHYLLAGSSAYDENGAEFDGDSRHVFVAAVPKNALESANVKMNWLTDAKHARGDELSTREVHLVPMSDGRWVVLWNEIRWDWDGDQGGGEIVSTRYAIVDATGKTVKGPSDLGVSAPGLIDPLVVGNQMIWYVLQDGKTAFIKVDMTKL